MNDGICEPAVERSWPIPANGTLLRAEIAFESGTANSWADNFLVRAGRGRLATLGEAQTDVPEEPRRDDRGKRKRRWEPAAALVDLRCGRGRAMSYLTQRISVACPLAEAPAYLRRYFRVHGDRSGEIARLALRVDVHVPGLPVALSLERSVIATVQEHSLRSEPLPRFTVQWAPEHPGPFPLFSGELVLEPEGTAGFALHLSGDYEPPLAFAGKVFDGAIGNRVATETARDLLERIGGFIERAHRGEREPV